MKHLIIFLVIASAVLAGDIKLPSGRVLKNATMGPMMSTKPTFPKTLALKYETSVDFKSPKAMTEEVEDVWKSLRFDADKGAYAAAVIMVVGPASGIPPFVSSAQQRNFVFEKKEGTWKMLPYPWDKEEKPNQSPEPTPGSVTPRATAPRPECRSRSNLESSTSRARSRRGSSQTLGLSAWRPTLGGDQGKGSGKHVFQAVRQPGTRR